MKNEFLDLKKAKIEPIALDEIFVQVHNTYNYWVSNYGMVVDKDLLCKGNKEYAPKKICWLPWTLNVMLSNSKKHYNAKYNRLNNAELYSLSMCTVDW